MARTIDRRLAPAAAALAVLLPAAGPAQQVAELVAAAERAGIRTAVAVLDADEGRMLFAHDARAARLPASNQKVVTAWAFLDALGTAYRFRTGFRVERGELVVEAGGDPNWGIGGPVDAGEALAALARELPATGLSALRGVRLERGAFGGPQRPEGWPRDQYARDYCAPSGAVALDQGCWVVELAPSGDHDAFVRLLSPRGALALSGRIAMTDDRVAGGRYHLGIEDGRLALRGHYWRRGPTRSLRGAIDDPELRFVAALRAALERGGIRFDDAAPAADLRLPAVESALAPALERCLRESSNFDAEQLLRVLGAELAQDGSFAGGTRVVRQRLEAAFGALPDELRIADGSGLSRDDRTTPELLVRVLAAAARAPFSTDFVGALPVPGEDGTLEKRFRDREVGRRVRAKTGTLAGVSALCGYLHSRAGSLLAFAILMDWPRPVRGEHPRVWQERIVAALDGLDPGAGAATQDAALRRAGGDAVDRRAPGR